MNINLLSRCTISNHWKRNVYKKTIHVHLNGGKVIRNSTYCTCPFVTLTSDLTSKLKKYNNEDELLSVLNNKLVPFNYVTSRRFCSTKGGPPVRRLPPLMNFPEIVWPSLIKSLRNFILTTFIIKPYFDRDFNLPDFVAGSKKAVEVVSARVSEGDISSLEGLVSKEIIPDLQRSIAQMTLSQRQQISINQDDIYFSFPYQIGIMFDDDENKVQKRFVEITMVYHTFRGLEEMKSKGEELPLNVGMLPQYRENISICNYRFIREFTKGVESGWTVNLLNHFKPSDYIDQ